MTNDPKAGGTALDKVRQATIDRLCERFAEDHAANPAEPGAFNPLGIGFIAQGPQRRRIWRVGDDGVKVIGLDERIIRAYAPLALGP